MGAVLVIFGAAPMPDNTPSVAMRRRVEAALRRARHDETILMLPTGGIGWREKRSGPTEAVMMRDLLMAGGVPSDRILLETAATDTLDSVLNVTRLLRARGYAGRVLIVTSPYHMRRCVTLMKLAGWKIEAVPADSSSGRRYIRWLREIPALLWDGFLLLVRRILTKN